MVADLETGAMTGKIMDLKDFMQFVEIALQNNPDDEIYQNKGKSLLRLLRNELTWEESRLQHHKNWVKSQGIKF